MPRGRRSTRDMFIRDVRRSGRWLPERGDILEHQIFRFAKVIVRDRCSTSYDLASLFRGRRSTLDRWSGKFAKRIGTRPSALHLTFQYWRKSRRIASFLMLSTSKMEEVSYNSLVFDVVTFKQWGNLAELLRFWRCQLRKIEEVSQNSFVFKLAGDITLRYTTLRYPPLPQLQLQYKYKYKSYTTLITLHYATTATTTTITTATTTTLHYNTLH